VGKKDISQSKFLSLVLRHKPETIGVSLDPNGWIAVDVLLNSLSKHGRRMSREDLERLVRESDKQRFALSEDGRRIRANQGHSVEVELDLSPQTPPEKLYHGTVEGVLASIMATGMRKGLRHHVHLSSDVETAERVGSRRGKPVILEIQAGAMHREGHVFFLSSNGVWLVDHVPATFISETRPSLVATPSDQAVKTLYRPTGVKELELIYRSGMKVFPPRLPEQPIFYPVLSQEYAAQIARDWNAKSAPDHIGFVLRFDVQSDYVAKFPIQKVGGKTHQELWVPAEEQAEFNRHIVGQIEILEVYRGEHCTLELDAQLLVPKTWLDAPDNLLR
jgi:putative RNA 2'-phosphotransferase